MLVRVKKEECYFDLEYNVTEQYNNCVSSMFVC